MPATPFDSAIYQGLFRDTEIAQLFSDSFELRAMLLVEGALARVQGEMGLIPLDASLIIDRAAREALIDPAALAAQSAKNGVPIPGLVAAFRKEIGSPEAAQYLHWGATSQDIMDTALALRLKRVIAIWEGRFESLLSVLGTLAETHAETAMPARTYGQVATPSSFGALVATWGHPILRHKRRLSEVKGDVLQVSLGGAAGTLSAMGAEGPEVRAKLAQALGLADPGHSWHAERDGIGAFAAFMAGLCASLGKIGEDLILMTQSGLNEVALSGAGGSSTMPQKQNPVAPSVLVALARQAAALSGALTGAGVHRQQRDGAAWFVEWMSLPQLVQLTGRALQLAEETLKGLTPQIAAMESHIDDGSGLIHAESYSFALARHLPRPEAQETIKTLCARVQSEGLNLTALVQEAYPNLDLSAAGGLGTAPAEARAFAALTR